MSSHAEGVGVLRDPCGTWPYHLRLLKRDPAYRKRFLQGQSFINEYVRRNADAAFRLSPAVIPVVVHIVHNTAAQNLSDAAVQNQIDALNRDYARANADVSTAPAPFAPLAADTGIRFALAIRDPNCAATNGITRTATATVTFDIFGSDDVKAAATGGADPWPADRYLNIWVCPAQPTQGGRSTFPGAPAPVDGVIVNYTVFGPGGAPYNLGRTTVHEVGHYFSLFHPFQGGCTGSDLAADTPQQASPNFGVPAFPHVSCSNGPNGDMFVNYMDYSNDAPRVLFTVDQVARMQAALTGLRASLLASDGLVAPPVPDVGRLWSADTPRDTGVEPDPLTEPMWQSEDIWVRNQNDGQTTQDHQNPIFRPPGSPSNFAYVRVRNASCAHAASGTLKLYWAKASSALAWPAPWDGTVAVPALMGGLIGSQPTGAIPGRGSAVLEFAWSPPNPANYSMFGGDQNHFCLLARIETAAVAPFGMTSPETANLYANVQNNNKIVWKNVEVVTTGGFELAGFVTIGNPGAGAHDTLLVVHAPTLGGQHPWGHAELDLPGPLAAKFRQAHLDPAVATLDHDTLRVKRLDKPIGPVKLAHNEYHTLGVRLVPGAHPPLFGLFLVDIIQHERRGKTDHVVGGQRVAFKLLPAKGRKQAVPAGRWWHSHEEDDGELQAFRPEGYEFPVSHGRWGFELHDDHSAHIYDIAAADGIDELEATWWTDDGEHLHIGLADPDRDDIAVHLQDTTNDKLVLRRTAVQVSE